MAFNVHTTELETALSQLATSMGMSVVEYVQSLGYSTSAQLTSAVTGVQAQIDAITELDGSNGAESLAEKIAAIDAVLSDENGVIQNILTKILENKQLVVDETARATTAEADLQSQITAAANQGSSSATSITNLENNLAAAIVAYQAKDASQDTLIQANADAIAILNGDNTVDGSVAKAVKAEEDRAKAVEAANTVKADANDVAIDDLQSQIDTLTGAGGNGGNTTIEGLNVRVTNVENTLNDTVDGNGDLVKGNNSRISDLEAAATAQTAA